MPPRPSSLLAPLVAALLVTCAAQAEEIRIEVSRSSARVQLRCAGGSATAGSEGAPLKLSAAAEHTLSAQGAQLLLDGERASGPLVVRPGAEALALDGKLLPGRLEIWAEHGALLIVNALDLEEYVAAVVTSEMPAKWPHAALEAQAVAARTYAVAQKIAQGPGARAHLGASVLDQVYAGAAHPQSGAQAAAKATYGEVLTWNASPIAAFFSASCGGKSESAEAAFEQGSGATPYLSVQDDGYADEGAPRLTWSVRLSLATISARLRKVGRIRDDVQSLAVSARTSSGRARTMRIKTRAGGQITMPASELRALLGYSELPSLLFDVDSARSEVLFKGRGSGHGVGLCQWGARGRAEAGAGYREILAHYYPGADIRRMY